MATPIPRAPALDLRSRALLHACVLSDIALRTAAATAVAGAVLVGAPSLGLREERRRLELYATLAARRDSATVFESPPGPPEVVPQLGRGPGVPGGRVELLRFKTSYVAINPLARAAYAAHERNGVVRAQHWRHDDGPRATLCVIHGFGASPAWFNTAFFSLRRFFADGWDVLLYTLPFHGGRAAQRVPLNGLEMFAGGYSRVHEAIIHAVHDFRALLDHLLAAGAQRVGVTGLSLGGYITALLAAVEPRLDFAIPNAPVTWIPSLMASWFPADLVAGLGRRAIRASDELVTAGMALHSPLTYPPVLPRDRLMVIGGLGDRLAPPEQAIRLWEHWGRPALHWYPGSHVLHLSRGRYINEMRELMGPPDRTAAASPPPA